MSGADVRIHDASVGCSQFGLGQAPRILARVVSGPDGTFSFGRIKPGNYWLYAQISNRGFTFYSRSTYSQAEELNCPVGWTTVSIQSSDVTGIRFVFDPR